jgi:hypothetical protein
MSEVLEWLQLPPNRVADTLKNKQLTAKATKVVEIARSTGTEPTKTKVGVYLLLRCCESVCNSLFLRY